MATEPQSNPDQKPNEPRYRSWLIIALLGAGLLAAVALGFWRHFSFSRPAGNGPAGPQVPREAFAYTWTTRPVLLVGLGDSVTEGFGARRGYGYFDRLATNPPDEFPEMKRISLSAVAPHLSVTNLSVSGSISLELAESQLPRLPHVDTNMVGLVVITTGGNDLIHNYGRTPPREQAMYGATFEQAKPWIDHFEQRLERIISQLITNFPGGCQIFLANIYDPTDGSGDIETAGLPAWPDGTKLLAAYNQIISRCAARHPQVHLINLHDAFLGHGIHCIQPWSKHYDSKDPHYWYYENLEDPNERGYDVIRRLFLIEMAKVAKQLE
jgi:lysophospholipase L1-like esterase